MGSAVLNAARSASPRHRRFKRLLATCLLDPALLPEPVPQPSDRDVVICGCPRSGTALLTAALHQPPAMATVMEPWDGLRLAPDELFSSIRDELADGELRRGRLDLGALEDRGTVSWLSDGEQTFPVATDAQSLVGIKWPTFWQYLPLLPDTRFLVCVRHPADVISSFEAQGGRLSIGLDYDVEFNGRLNAELSMVDHHEDRRLAFYDRVNETVLAHRDRPNVLLVHYERWHTDPAGLLTDISTFLGRDLTDPPVTIVDPETEIDPALRARVAAESTTAAALGYR